MMRARAPAWMAALLLIPCTVAGAHAAEPDQPLPPSSAHELPQAEKPADARTEARSSAYQPASPLAAPQDPLAPIDDAAQTADLPSPEAMATIDWVIATHDNNDLPFMVIDKVAAEVFVFDSSGKKVASAPALLGVTVGDDETPGSGDRELSRIPIEDRQTPAGRFVAKFGRAAGHRDVLWIDYPSAISLHAVINVRNQHRFERLKSSTASDNRITYGCINVPTAFYATAVRPIFKDSPGIVYILPEKKALNEVFPAMLQQAAAPTAAQTAQ
jgi:hypothetical protein